VSDDRLYRIHIVESIEKIESYTRGGQDAVVRNFEIIGEAVKQIPGSLKGKRPDIPWRRIVGLQDVLIHQYMSVDLEAVWVIVGENLPILKQAVTGILADGDSH
jgi:uncharacterized protein with HEPN domain